MVAWRDVLDIASHTFYDAGALVSEDRGEGGPFDALGEKRRLQTGLKDVEEGGLTDVRGQDVCVADSCGHHFDDDFVGVHFLKADGLDGEGAAGRGYDQGRCEVVVGGLGGGHGDGVK